MRTVSVAISNLVGRALDWAACTVAFDNAPIIEDGHVFLATDSGHRSRRANVSQDWSLGGPLFERENISIRAIWINGRKAPAGHPHAWRADLDFQDGRMTLGEICEYGPTALVAALRCLVASRHGDALDVPVELLDAPHDRAA